MALIKLNNRSSEDNAIHGKRNILINGAMEVAQRGNSATGKTTGGYYTVDMFRTDQNGCTVSYSQVALSSSDDPFSYGIGSTWKVEVTTAASSDAGTMRMDTRVEAQNLRKSGWDYTSSSSYVTFSCWCKSSLAGTYYIGFRTDDGTAKQYTQSFTLVADTWKKITMTIPGDSGLTFNDDTGMGALIAIHVDERTAQSDSGHTLDGWQTYSSTSRTPDFSQDWSETLNATFFTTGWQLELGDTASPFEHRSYGEELSLCQRYYEKFGQGWWARFESGSNLVVNGQFKVEKRVAPTISLPVGDDIRLYEWGVADRDATPTLSSTAMAVNGGHFKLSGFSGGSTGEIWGVGGTPDSITEHPFEAKAEL